ncbi:MAG: PhzF family phenazine biosynthesis protein [Acidobacteria bacterium]|jgi:PhzF family phenazine biosynthesis protein|nr:PhzF family phenazine biosynthesis protein [Acidobacteriota bacterium]MBP8272867.1 PhzF family phenazine biosynthesis protein [Acidobacteriota bacterium]
MSLPLLQVDAFTSAPFRGNPAAVVWLESPRPDAWMQQVAAEMNLSETAFIEPRDDGFGLRWFTPVAEVNLCGHATLASAHALYETGRLAMTDVARFHTRSGVLTAKHDGQWIELNFPVVAPEPVDAPAGLIESLGVAAAAVRYVGRGGTDYLVELDTEATVRGLQPDFVALAAVECRGVTVTAASGDGACDFVSRFFAPKVGINEDPVTGSAHCRLVPYWSARIGRVEMLAHQVSARGGVLLVKLDGDRVRMAGQAVTVLRGELLA